MLGNLLRRLISSQKCLLYRSCILPILLYGFPLWYYNKAPLAYLLRNIQWRATIWILGAFQTSLSFGIEAIVGLIPIYSHLQKLSDRLQLRMQSLPSNHIIKSMLESRHSNTNNNHHLLLEKLTPKQQLNIKSPIIDVNNRLNRIFHSFYLLDRKNEESKRAHICKLDELIL